MLLPAALETEHEQSSLASEQMLLAVGPETKQEPSPAALEAEQDPLLTALPLECVQRL